MQAIQSLWPYPELHSRLALLLSNRAATLLSLGRPMQALQDCQLGLKVGDPAQLLSCQPTTRAIDKLPPLPMLQYDPAFSRCALRIATCHCRLGDFPSAQATLEELRRHAGGLENSHDLCRSLMAQRWAAAPHGSGL